MRIAKDYIKNLPEGGTLSVVFGTAPEIDNAYQTALTARKELGLDRRGMRISRYAKEMRIEIERYRDNETQTETC